MGGKLLPFVNIFMTKMSQIHLGQPVAACPAHDKWTLLAALTSAAAEYDLNHRTLGVLKALLSFYPDRALPSLPGSAVVFPSNQTLSLRLNGMPESTLRRHLAKLVASGVISRQDSPNRKRFARKYGIPFGFDLSPLSQSYAQLSQAAERAREREEQLAALRDRLALVRAYLKDSNALNDDHPVMQAAHRTLRRKPCQKAMVEVLKSLEPLVDKAPCPIPAFINLSGNDAQIERHIQSTNKIDSVSKTTSRTTSSSKVALADVLGHCREYKTYYPDLPDSWNGVIRASDNLHGMMGIDRSLYVQACSKLGERLAAFLVLSMLERITRISKPGAYFRSLLARWDANNLNLKAMLHPRTAENCQLTISGFP